MDQTFSSIDLVGQCLLDSERSSKFKEAIEKVVSKDSLVLDAGTGSGILSLFAARAGAKKIYSIEYDSFVAKNASKNFENNGFGDRIKIILGDARNLYIEGNIVFDVVIMEMLTTGMVDEHQIAAINNLRKKGYVDEHTVFIPFKHDTYVELSQYDFNNYGMDMRMTKHLWKFLKPIKPEFLAEKKLLNSVDFTVENSLEFKEKLIIPVNKKGIFNSIYLTSITHLDENIKIGDTLAINGPVVFPLDEDLLVEQGDRIELDISYIFGGGFNNFTASAKKII